VREELGPWNTSCRYTEEGRGEERREKNRERSEEERRKRREGKEGRKEE
jgi:hypothetical protein